MKRINLSIDNRIYAQHPDVSVGYLCAQQLDNAHGKILPGKIMEDTVTAVRDSGITKENIADAPSVRLWRGIYSHCGVKPNKYRSSLESLLRRFLKESYRPIHTVVDLYNYVSLANLLPMGGYDSSRVSGGIRLRYAKQGDRFVSLGGESIEVIPTHIVYADDEEVICWMWNHRDATKTMITPHTTSGIFLIDGAGVEAPKRIRSALKMLTDGLIQLGAIPTNSGILDGKHNEITTQV